MSMKKLVIARETMENIVEIVEPNTLSSHMKAVLGEIRTIIEQAEQGGLVIITGERRVYTTCACGCGRHFLQPKRGRKRRYYNDVCRTRGARKRYALRKKEEAKAKALDKRRRRTAD